MLVSIDIDDTVIAATVRGEVSRMFAPPTYNGSSGGAAHKLIERIVREWLYSPETQQAITERVRDEAARLLPGAINNALETALTAAIKQSVKAMQKDGTLAAMIGGE